MTKEELKQEAEEWLCKNLHSASEEDFIKAMVDIAEPREKRIEELIALINAERERQEKCDDVHLRTIAELEKENAELKSENQKWKDGIALKDEEIGCIETDFNTFKSEAKEIIDELLSSCFGYNSKTVNYEVKTKAEQFLKEIEE